MFHHGDVWGSMGNICPIFIKLHNTLPDGSWTIYTNFEANISIVQRKRGVTGIWTAQRKRGVNAV